MPWIELRSGNSAVLKDITASIEKPDIKWITRTSLSTCLNSAEGNVTIDLSQPCSLKDIFSLKLLDNNFKLACFNDALFVVLPGLSFVITGNRIFCRRSDLNETEALESCFSFMKICPTYKSLEILLEGEQIYVEELVPIVFRFVEDFLHFLFDYWKTVSYGSPSKKDLQSGFWREQAQNWIRSFRQLYTEVELFMKMVSTISTCDRSLVNILPSPVVFMERLLLLHNEMEDWRVSVDGVDHWIPLYFQQEETFLLKLDLPIVTGSAFLGFVLLVVSFTCMNITIPPYNSPQIIKIWAVFISILGFFLLLSFSSMFYWMRKNAPRTDL